MNSNSGKNGSNVPNDRNGCCSSPDTALTDDAFGVRCDLDIQVMLEEKPGKKFRQYRILCTCNPPLVYEASTGGRMRG